MTPTFQRTMTLLALALTACAPVAEDPSFSSADASVQSQTGELKGVSEIAMHPGFGGGVGEIGIEPIGGGGGVTPGSGVLPLSTITNCPATPPIENGTWVATRLERGGFECDTSAQIQATWVNLESTANRAVNMCTAFERTLPSNWERTGQPYQSNACLGYGTRNPNTQRIVRLDDEPPPECRRDSECGSTEVCRSGDCVKVECKRDSHCEGLAYCRSNECVQVECKNDSHCSGLAYCRADKCVEVECKDDSHCSDTAYCVSEQCVEVECKRDSHCPDDFYCDNNECFEFLNELTLQHKTTAWGDGGQCPTQTGHAAVGEWTPPVRLDTDNRDGGCWQSLSIVDPESVLGDARIQLEYWHDDRRGGSGQCGLPTAFEPATYTSSVATERRDLSDSWWTVDTDNRPGGCQAKFSIVGSDEYVLDVRFYADGHGGQCGNASGQSGHHTAVFGEPVQIRYDMDGRAGGCMQSFRLRRADDAPADDGTTGGGSIGGIIGGGGTVGGIGPVDVF